MALTDYINQPKPTIPLPPIPLPPITPPTKQEPEQRQDPEQLQLMSGGVEYFDRYEFNPGDSELWLHLFAMADAHSGEKLATTLEIIRNTGAILVPSEKYGYIIKPVFGPQGFAGEQEYDQERWHLRQYESTLLALLKKLKEVQS